MSAEAPKELRAGLWLGRENQIRSMRPFKYGWRATDSTGATYRQRDFPDGLGASEEPKDGRTLARVPWPARR